jgi:hypothetical protein
MKKQTVEREKQKAIDDETRQAEQYRDEIRRYEEGLAYRGGKRTKRNKRKNRKTRYGMERRS